jgi:Arylsulfatase A and related enzymes
MVFMETNRKFVKKDFLDINSDLEKKRNASMFVTAGIESYDSQDEGSALDQNDRRKMNVIILFPDDWRHDSIGSENQMIKTPYLDSLAKQGIRFRQHAVTTSICWQSRATLFSGQWASRHRSFKLRCPHFSVGKAWSNTWPAILRRNGYFVGHIGKWQYHNSDIGSRFDWSSFFEGECPFNYSCCRFYIRHQ